MIFIKFIVSRSKEIFLVKIVNRNSLILSNEWYKQDTIVFMAIMMKIVNQLI